MRKDKDCTTCKYEQENLSDHPCAECWGDIGVCWEPKEPRFQMADDESAADQFVDDADEKESALNTQIAGQHYKGMAIQPMEYSMKNNLNACQHTAIKYISRYKDKNGIEDLEKAKHCIDMLIEFEQENQ